VCDTSLHIGDTNSHIRYQPGALVHARGRECEALAHEPLEVLQLRPSAVVRNRPPECLWSSGANRCGC
jgi:hypothetical protein